MTDVIKMEYDLMEDMARAFEQGASQLEDTQREVESCQIFTSPHSPAAAGRMRSALMSGVGRVWSCPAAGAGPERCSRRGARPTQDSRRLPNHRSAPWAR